jgi:hypothetical protein
MNNNLFNSELSTELEDITLCFVRDDIGEYLNVKLSDLVEWEQDKLDNYFNYDPALCDILHVDDDLNNIIKADHYCPCYGGLFKDLNLLNEFITDGDDLDMLNTIMEDISNLQEAIDIVSRENYVLYPGCNDNYDLGCYIYEEFYSYDYKDFPLSNYIDFEALGRDQVMSTSGFFSNKGYIEYI